MSKRSESDGPLAGLKVIDFGHYYAGPMAAMLLADQGATVIRIVRPGDPELPSPQYRLLNRNKNLLVLDLKSEECREQAKSLVCQADVLIENFRPGVMRRLGLDYASIKEDHPELIYLSLPGFASTDKERAHIQAWEGVMSAAACSYTHTHWWRHYANYPPLYTWVPMCSAHGSMQGVIAVLAALIAKENTGQGTIIEAPLVAAALVGQMNEFIGPLNQGEESAAAALEAFTASLAPDVYDASDTKDVFLDKLDRLSSTRIVNLFSTWYPCKGDRHLFIWPNSEVAIDRALRVMGIDNQIKRQGIVNEGPWVTGLDNNLYSLNDEHTEWLLALIKRVLRGKTAIEWETLLADAGLAVSVIRTREEWLTLAPAHQSGIFTTMDNGVSSLTVPGQFCDVSGPGGALISNVFEEPKSISLHEASKLFNATHPNKAAAKHGKPIKKGELLQGLKVLDLTNLVAGPTATNTLAHYGADVIKADPPRYIHPGLLAAGMLEVNQGKRSILTDLTTQPGREVFERLVKWADVIVHNCVDGVAERLGVTLDQLQAIKPNVIVCQFSAHGGLYRNCGGWESRPGFDGNAQSVSGMMTHYGSLERPHLHGQITCGDIMGGIGGTFAVLIALYQLQKSGYAGEARSSLDRMINYMQLPGMVAENGCCEWGEAGGQFAIGESMHNRMYQCQDRWIYVQAPKERSDDLKALVANHTEAGEADLENCFLGEGHRVWLERLQSAGFACHLVAEAQDIINRPMRKVGNEASDEVATETFELMVRERHPAGVPIINLVPSWTRIGEERSYRQLTPSLRYGEHTKAILGELGYSAVEIERLFELKVSHSHFPAMGPKDYFFNAQKKSIDVL